MTYVLWVILKRGVRLKVGNLGRVNFRKGVYLYVGSAKKNLAARIRRHLAKKKKIFWHIDYLLSSGRAKIKQVWVSVRLAECKSSRLLYREGYGFIDKFGSSDCNCPSHLFFIAGEAIVRGVKRAGELLGRERFKRICA